MKKIKIVFAIPNFTTAGSGRELFNIIERLDKNVFEVFILVQSKGGQLYDEIADKSYSILVHPFIADNSKSLLNQIADCRKLSEPFKKYAFDIWQSFNWSSDYTEALVARFSGCKYIYVKKNMNWNRLAWKVKSFLAHSIVARNTTLTRTYFSHWLYKSKTVWITGGVDTETFKPALVHYIRDNWGISKEAKIITCVAQLVPIKDQVTLIKAVANIEGVHLVLAGAEKDEAYVLELRQLIVDLKIENRVLMTGGITNIPEVLNASDMFVLSTSRLHGHEEGCPVSLLEAMSTGIPVIASDVAGNNDLIIHEKTGLLFAPGNVDELRQCIERYVREPAFAKKMAATALEKVYKEHRLQIETEAFSELYKRAVLR